MQIVINGKQTKCPTSMNIKELLDQLDYEAEAVAVALNGAVVPYSEREQTYIHEGDDIEILSPMQGG